MNKEKIFAANVFPNLTQSKENAQHFYIKILSDIKQKPIPTHCPLSDVYKFKFKHSYSLISMSLKNRLMKIFLFLIYLL